MTNLISRQAAVDAVKEEEYPCESDYDEGYMAALDKTVWIIEKWLPSAQPERLTDDDFETIRIHLNAYKESLCNQRRWKEAEDYQRLIDRFVSFASAQPEIIRCKDCAKHEYCRTSTVWAIPPKDDWYCADAERRTDERERT